MGQLVLEILALIGNVLMNLLQSEHCFAASMRTLLATSHTPLSLSQFRLRLAIQAWVLDNRVIGQDNKRVEFDIDADCLLRLRQRLRLRFARKACEPLTVYLLEE